MGVGAGPHFPKYFLKSALPARSEKFPKISPDPRASWTDRETVSVNTKEGGEHVPRPDTGTEV